MPIFDIIFKRPASIDFLNLTTQLSKLDLLKSTDINIDLSEDEKHELKGLYVVDEEKLKGLDKEELYKLHQHQYLQHIYMIGASIGNVNKLISLKKSR